MKITKTASGKQIVKLSQQEWTNFGKKAGWLDENGKLIAKAEVADELVREAQPAPAAPKTKPGEKTKPKQNPDKKPSKTPWNPDSTPSEKPKASVSDSKEDLEKEAEVSATNLPTIASELAKLKKK